MVKSWGRPDAEHHDDQASERRQGGELLHRQRRRLLRQGRQRHAVDGQGAQALGLSGTVDQRRFAELLDGRIDEHTQLRRTTPSEARKERLGYDLTFSAPKGVSLQALVHGDERIIAAHDKAVAAALREAEMLAAARSTVNGKTTSSAPTRSLPRPFGMKRRAKSIPTCTRTPSCST